jgi:hypothetical protein
MGGGKLFRHPVVDTMTLAHESLETRVPSTPAPRSRGYDAGVAVGGSRYTGDLRASVRGR